MISVSWLNSAAGNSLESVDRNLDNNGENKEWVIVLDDPRPARLKGWQRSEYSTSGDYNNALELRRFGNKIAKQHDLSISDQWLIESLGVYCLIAGFDGDEQSTLTKLHSDDKVQWVQSANTFGLQKTSNASDKDHAQLPANLLDPPELRLPVEIDGKGITVALVDSAVDTNHPDLKGQIKENNNLVPSRAILPSHEKHGTAMAGIIVADRISDMGVTGIAPAATLKVFRGCWEDNDKSSTNCNTLSLAKALDLVARSDADILNLSLSGPKDRLLNRLIDVITDQGTLVVTSLDQDRSNSDRFPASSENVLVVGYSKKPNRAETQIALSAPGIKVVAAPNNKADFMQGHSVATAYTSGIFALCKQVEAKLSRAICVNTDSASRPSEYSNISDLVDAINEALTEEI